MKVHLTTTDPEIQGLFRELTTRPSGDLDVLSGELPDQEESVDVYVWDFDPARQVPPAFSCGQLQNVVYLVRRQDLAALHESLTYHLASVILRPVNIGRLELALEQAMGRQNVTRGVTSLRHGRDAIMQCLLQANLKLQEYDQDRTNFITRVVHDFRAPLTSIKGYCGLLSSGKLGPLLPSQAEVIERMCNSGVRLARMASALFQLGLRGRLTQEQERELADLELSVRQAVHEMGPQLQEKRISLSFDWQDPVDPLYFEPNQVEQVLVNLLENACTFTPRGSVIRLRGYPWFWERRFIRGTGQPSEDRRINRTGRSNSFRIDIADSGPGIPPELIDTLFEEYTTYCGGRDRSGGGVGLAICKAIVASHGGQIWAETKAGGATFSFVLPHVEPARQMASSAKPF